MSEKPVEIVCVNAGDKFPDVYVQRLYNMLGRNLTVPFRLTCFTDRRRDLSREIEQIDIGARGERGFFNKMLLYDSENFPAKECFYLDITLVIIRDITHLVDFARSTGSDLVCVRDWKRPVLNTCVQWIRHGETTRALWEFYKSGARPEYRTRGDQEFVFDALFDLGLSHAPAYFPSGEIQSFKVLRDANRESKAGFAELWSKASIVKFHGSPRQTDILDPWRRIFAVTMRYPHHALTDWPFLVDEVKTLWK